MKATEEIKEQKARKIALLRHKNKAAKALAQSVNFFRADIRELLAELIGCDPNSIGRISIRGEGLYLDAQGMYVSDFISNELEPLHK